MKEENVPILHGPLTDDELNDARRKQVSERESKRDKAFKRRQLSIAQAANKISKTNVKITISLAVVTTVTAATALYQGILASEGLAETREATSAAAKSAYVACIAAEISRAALIDEATSNFDVHASSVATMEQADLALEGMRAEIGVTVLPPIFDANGTGVLIQLYNAGKTAAVDVNAQFRVVFVNRDVEPDLLYPKDETVTSFNRLEEPGVQFTSNPDLKSRILWFGPNHSVVVPTAEDIEAYNSEQKDIIFFGKVTYKDVFGIRHWRQWCQPFHKFHGGELGESGHKACFKYNTSDSPSLPMVDMKSQKPLSIPEISCEEVATPAAESKQSFLRNFCTD